MIITTEMMLIAALLSGAIVWLAHAGQRLNASWAEVSLRMRRLKDSQKKEARTLGKNEAEIERLSVEMREIRQEIETTTQATAAKRKELAAIPAPRAREIYVSSEFPPNKQARAWVARLKRTEGGKRTDGEVHQHELVWAADYNSALNRAEQTYGRQGYNVSAVHRFE